MPFSGATFSKLFNWAVDAIRNPKIQDARFDAEFGGIATGLTQLATTTIGALNISQTGSGSLGATAPTDFGYPYDHIQIASDGYDASGFAAGKQVTTALLIDQYPNNSSKGNHNGLTAACWVPPGATVDTSTNWGYCGALLFGKSDINLGGTNTGAGAKGAVFGANPYATLGASATNAYGCVACEADVLTLAGSSLKLRVGVSSVDLGSAVQGASVDSAYTVGALAGSIGWKAGLTFTDMNGGTPLSTTAKLITTSGTATVDSGVDISGYTISTAAFKSTGFSVDGSGNIAGKTTIITSNALHAIAIGPNGNTNPAFVVQGNVASQVTGIAVVGAASGGGAGFSVTSSSSNELLAINSLGAGDTYINNSSTGVVRIGNGLLPKTDDAAALGSATERWADVFLSTGAVINYNNGNYTLTHSSGSLTASGSLAASGFIANAAASSIWALDASSTTISVANNATATLAAGSGIIAITDTTTTGASALYLLGAATTTMIKQIPGGPFVDGAVGAGSAGIVFSGGSYVISNKTGVTVAFGVVGARNRTS
jgi:hypothetical protein